ncbi:EamA family transporter [Pseudoduganella violaceinigra]|uniref:EamA family transporter n=1 Tax=Pseudoduganella violaceinigra TaxID=246602 RepID=UPI000481E6F9|nr:EamA family transporter [Pseudoduganella violaceinigra]
MSPTVVAVVLCGALLHASWNALVKAGRDPFFSTVLLTSGAALLSLATLPFLTQPAAASWPFVVASTVIHYAYYGLLAAAYRHGDMSHAYPLMRGSAPLLVAASSVPLLGEHLSLTQYAAVACICGGIFGATRAVSAAGGTAPTSRRRSTGYALLNALLIAAYTLVDGVGARASGAPAAYVMWLHVLSGTGLLAWCVVRCPREFKDYAKQYWRAGILGGAGKLGAYGLALWAMTLAPVAAVAALRETSILFAALIARFFLSERISHKRAMAISAIAAGAVLMRLA